MNRSLIHSREVLYVYYVYGIQYLRVCLSVCVCVFVCALVLNDEMVFVVRRSREETRRVSVARFSIPRNAVSNTTRAAVWFGEGGADLPRRRRRMPVRSGAAAPLLPPSIEEARRSDGDRGIIV